MLTVRERSIIIFLIMLNVSFAVIIESGDAGEEFALNMAELKCQEDAEAVYLCLGNVVKTVSSNGSTFYKPDGKVVYCPDVSPSEMGAECLQMMVPNYCPEESQCGVSEPETFPGGANESASNATVAELEPTQPEPAAQPETKAVYFDEENEFDATTAAPAQFEFALGNLLWVVLLLGTSSVGILFMLFKKSMEEE